MGRKKYMTSFADFFVLLGGEIPLRALQPFQVFFLYKQNMFSYRRSTFLTFDSEI